MIIDVAMPGDKKVSDEEQEKIKKYRFLKEQIARLWQMKKAIVIPIAVGTFGSITTTFEKYIENIESFGIEIRIQHIQKSALLGTVRIIRKALPCYIPRKGYCCETFNISHSKNQRY